ncbi:unnamed protein product, partial [Effrenium voratum]
QAISLNSDVLRHVASVWVSVFDFESVCAARTPPIRALSRQVNKFWQLMRADLGDGAQLPGRIGIHAQSWGIRKLLSHSFRRMRSGHLPRAACLKEIHELETHSCSQCCARGVLFGPRILTQRRFSASSWRLGTLRRTQRNTRAC